MLVINIFLYIFRSSLVINFVFTFLRVKSSHNPFDPLNIPLNRYIAISTYYYRRITYYKNFTILTDTVLRIEKTPLVDIGYQLGTSYGADIFPTVLLCLYKIVIRIIITFSVIISFLGIGPCLGGSYMNSIKIRRNYGGSGSRCRRYFRLRSAARLGGGRRSFFVSRLRGGGRHHSYKKIRDHL